MKSAAFRVGRFEDTPGQYFRYNGLKRLAFTQENPGGMGIIPESFVLFPPSPQKIAISSENFTFAREKRYQVQIFLIGCEAQRSVNESIENAAFVFRLEFQKPYLLEKRKPLQALTVTGSLTPGNPLYIRSVTMLYTPAMASLDRSMVVKGDIPDIMLSI